MSHTLQPLPLPFWWKVNTQDAATHKRNHAITHKPSATIEKQKHTHHMLKPDVFPETWKRTKYTHQATYTDRTLRDGTGKPKAVWSRLKSLLQSQSVRAMHDLSLPRACTYYFNTHQVIVGVVVSIEPNGDPQHPLPPPAIRRRYRYVSAAGRKRVRTHYGQSRQDR